jgi:hypothetical protein
MGSGFSVQGFKDRTANRRIMNPDNFEGWIRFAQSIIVKWTEYIFSAFARTRNL